MSSTAFQETRRDARRTPPLRTAKSLPSRPSQGKKNVQPQVQRLLGFSRLLSFINGDNYTMTGGKPDTKGAGFGPVGKVPGQNQNTRVLIFPPLTGWPWTGHLLSLSCCSFWQMKVVGPNGLTLQDSMMSLAQTSLGSCGPPQSNSSPGVVKPLMAWGAQSQDSQAPNIHYSFGMTLI